LYRPRFCSRISSRTYLLAAEVDPFLPADFFVVRFEVLRFALVERDDLAAFFCAMSDSPFYIEALLPRSHRETAQGTRNVSDSR
jgi:hypothetical protein